MSASQEAPGEPAAEAAVVHAAVPEAVVGGRGGDHDGVAGQPLRRVLIGFAPALTAVAGAVAVLRAYGTPVPVSLAYLAALLVVVVLPGTLVWRAVRGPQVSFTEDVAIGSAIGLAIQALLGFALGPLGLTGWAWLWGPFVVVLSVALPVRSRLWQGPGPSTSRVSAWVQAAAVLAATVWIGATGFASNPLAYLDGRGAFARAIPVQVYVDMPYHQSLAAGIDQHAPLVYPYLYDEPLHYHLFVYEHLAAMANASGIDLTWIVHRLWILPLVALGIVLAGVLARRLSGAPLAAPLAAAVVALSATPTVYGWTTAPFQDPGYLHFATPRSPTQTFGVPIFLAALTVAVVLLRRGLRGNGALLAGFAVLSLAAGGSKATFLPVLVCGLLLAGVVVLVTRASWRPIAVLTGVAGAGFAFVALVLLGGKSGSLVLARLAVLQSFVVSRDVAGPGQSSHQWFILGLTLLAWFAAGAGGFLLLRRPSDPAFWLLVGCVGAGASATLLTQANGLSELYFLYSSWPLLGVLGASGVATAVPRWGPARIWLLVGGLLAGVGATRAIAASVGAAQPPMIAPALPHRMLLLPWATLGAVVLAAAVLAWVLARRRPVEGMRPLVVAVVVGAVLVTGSAVSLRSGQVVASARTVIGGAAVPAEGVVIPRDGAEAAVAIRDLSEPGDVVATNAHCNGPPNACDARHFWIAALTERRVLVEGWAYPEGFRPGRTRNSPFWDTERYDANEAVFADPSRAAVDLLAQQYGVRWLLVDRTVSVESDKLRDVARLVLESDKAAVYEIGG